MKHPPLVKGGQPMVDTAIIVAGCAALALMVSAATASIAVAGWAVGGLMLAAGLVMYWIGWHDGKSAARKLDADRVCDELRRRWEA